MSRSTFVAGYRLAGAALVVSAAVYTIVVRSSSPTFTLANFLSFFTVLSNLFAAAILLVGAASVGRPTSPGFEYLRGAAALYLVTTGLVYELFLAEAEQVTQATPFYTNLVMHQIMPALMVFDWLFEPPRHRLDWRYALWWIAFPVAYSGYTLARGPIVDWYPYPFIDPTEDGGYSRVALNCLGIAVGVAALTLLVKWVGNRRHRPRQVAAA